MAEEIESLVRREGKQVSQRESRVLLCRQGASQIGHDTGKRADLSTITGCHYTTLRLKGTICLSLR